MKLFYVKIKHNNNIIGPFSDIVEAGKWASKKSSGFYILFPSRGNPHPVKEDIPRI